MNLDIPQAWMVEAVKSPYDLDNIYLKEVRIETKRIHYAPQDVLQFYICMFINVFVTTSDMLSPHVYILQVDQSVIGNFELEYILIEGMINERLLFLPSGKLTGPESSCVSDEISWSQLLRSSCYTT